MKVLLTGHEGYLGAIISGVLTRAGHQVTGVDAGWYADCSFGPPPATIDGLRRDVRDLRARDLRGYDAVVHMAALSNDPLGDINPSLTYDINHHASVTLAEAAKQAGVERFVFSSSCSLYGAGGNGLLDESARFNPVTAYGDSKVGVEEELASLADDDFSPVSLRNATAYGVSPRLRADIVVNDLVGHAVTSGAVLLTSDGSAWRPLVHVADICSAFSACLTAPRDAIHGRAFNVGRTGENYRIRQVAELVAEIVPDCRVTFADGASTDARDYRVAFDAIESSLPGYEPSWTVARGIEELAQAYVAAGLDRATWASPRFHRLRTILELRAAGRLDERLRWTSESRWTTADV
jgi:nucleoside-diphosphate-sugar epimerase